MALTSVDLDPELIARARSLTGEKSNRAVLDLALRRLIAAKQKRAMIDGIAELTDPAISARLNSIERSPADLLVTCPPQVMEFCHSARTPAEHDVYRERISLGFPLERAPDESLVLTLRIWL